ASEATYVAAASPFRDLVATAANTAERVGANLSVAFTPSPRWTVRGTHENLVAPSVDHLLIERTVDQVHGSVNASGTRFSGGVYDTTGDDRHSVGVRLGLGRRFDERLDVGTEFFSSRVE